MGTVFRSLLSFPMDSGRTDTLCCELVAWCSISGWDARVEGSHRQAIASMQQASASLVDVGKEAVPLVLPNLQRGKQPHGGWVPPLRFHRGSKPLGLLETKRARLWRHLQEVYSSRCKFPIAQSSSWFPKALQLA